MAPSFAKITGGSSASGGQSPVHIVSEAPAPTIQVVQDSLDEALKFSESALICRFNGFWPRLIALHNWISEMWCHYDLQANLAICDEEANYLLEGVMPTVSPKF